MVILVNHYSASASEIVSACLQDHKRAVIMGERTWGKGSVQNIIELENGRSALKLTTAAYKRPSGKNIHRFPDSKDKDEWGVMPDLGYELGLNDRETHELLVDRRNRDIIVAHAAGRREVGDGARGLGRQAAVAPVRIARFPGAGREGRAARPADRTCEARYREASDAIRVQARGREQAVCRSAIGDGGQVLPIARRTASRDRIADTEYWSGLPSATERIESRSLLPLPAPRSMHLLTIETTCDETAAAIVTDRLEVKASVVASQDDLHRRFGGVVPEIASRAHLERILPVIHETLQRANLTLADIDAVAVANTPGLAGSLLVGLVAAKALCVAIDKPLLAVNHLQAHIYACRIAAGERGRLPLRRPDHQRRAYESLSLPGTAGLHAAGRDDRRRGRRGVRQSGRHAGPGVSGRALDPEGGRRRKSAGLYPCRARSWARMIASISASAG